MAYSKHTRNRFIEAIERIGVHDHACLIYETHEKQFNAVAPFIQAGLVRGEQCLYVADDNSAEEVLDALNAYGIDVNAALRSGALYMEIVTSDWCSVPDGVPDFLIKRSLEAKAAGFSALRMTSEMTWVLECDTDIEKLVEYEADSSSVMLQHDAVVLCQYNRSRFAPEMIRDIIRTHPIVIYDNTVAPNPYYVPPDEFLAPAQPGREVERLLHTLQKHAQIEAALESERDRAQQYLEVAGTVIVVINADRRVQLINRSGCELLGYPEEEILGKRWADHFIPESLRDASKAQFSQLMRGDTDILEYVETPVLTRSGEERIIAWKNVVLHDNTGHFQALLSSGEDITERRQNEQALTELLSLSRTLLKTLELDEVFSQATDAAVAIVPAAEHGSLQLLEPEGDVMRTVAISDLKVTSVITFRPGKGVAGHALQSRTVVNVPDILEDERFIPSDRPPRFRSLMVAPLRIDERVLGTLSLSSEKTHAFSSTDEALIQLIAGQVATAIENARLFERMSSALSETHMFAALLEATSDLVALSDMNHQVLYINPAGLQITGYPKDFDYTALSVQNFYPPETLRFMTGIFPDILKAGVWSEDMDILRRDGTLVPVSQVIVIVRDDEGTPYAIGVICRDISAERADAAERERLREETQRSADLLRAVIDTVPDAVYVKDTEGRFLLANQPTANLMEVSIPDALLGKKDADFFDSEWVETFRQDETHIIETGEPLINKEEPVLSKFSEEEGWILTTKVPLQNESGDIVGIVGVAREITEQKRQIREREQLLATVERRNAQLQAAVEISTTASSVLDLDLLLQKVVDLIRDQFGFYYVGLFLVDLDGVWTDEPERWVVLQAGTGTPGKKMVEQKHKLRIGGESMTGWCVAHARARIALDVEEEVWHFANPYLPETRSEMALPLVSRALVIGALTIQSRETDAFSEADVAVLQTMANQVANAIENVRLLEQTRQHAAQLSMLNEIGRAVTSLLDLESILDVIYTQLKGALPVDAFYVALYDSELEKVSYPLMYDGGRRCEEASSPLPPETLLGQTIHTAAPQLLNRTPEQCKRVEKRYLMGDEAKISASLLFAPLKIGARVIGAISAQSYRFDIYSSPDLSLLSGVATQAAIAIENARLHAEVQGHVEELDRRVEERTKELHQALIRARESERAKSSFVATVNHELRTPLSNLKLYLGLLERGSPEKRTFYLDTLRREVDRLSNLVEDVLSIARLEEGAAVELGEVDLGALAQDMMIRFMPLAEDRQIDFSFSLAQDAPFFIRADPDQIMRVFVNLLGNALTYTQKGGRVKLAVEKRREQNAPWAVVSVQDNGPGIAPEEQAQIFQRFYRGSAGRESGLPGSGLGLPIVKEIVQLHNGHLELESQSTQGSTFSVWLPLAR